MMFAADTSCFGVLLDHESSPIKHSHKLKTIIESALVVGVWMLRKITLKEASHTGENCYNTLIEGRVKNKL